MARLPQLQPRFSMIVRKKDDPQNTLDITKDIDSVTLEVDTDRISILSFEINNVAKGIYDEWLDTYIRVDFYGGFYTGDNYFKEVNQNGKLDFEYSKGSTNEHFRHLFNGTITSLQYSFKPNGTKTLVATCKDFSWGVISKDNQHFAYPSTSCKRQFADGKTTLKFSEIVEGICTENGFAYKEALKDGIVSDFEYTLAQPAVQDGVTDFKFLRQLAEQNACYIWAAMDPDNGGAYTLFVVDKEKSRNVDQRLEFVWLDRDGEGEFIQGSHLQDGDSANEYSKLKNNQLKLEEVSVEVSPQIAGTNRQQITQFNNVTGKEESYLVSYDETKDDIIYYELNRELVKKVEKEDPQRAKAITDMGAFSIPREVFLEFYTAIATPKGVIKAIDRPMHGIEVTGKVIGNVNIEPFQSYQVHGIGKWSSRKSTKSLRYYLHGLTHTWDASGFWTEVRMKA